MSGYPNYSAPPGWQPPAYAPPPGAPPRPQGGGSNGCVLAAVIVLVVVPVVLNRTELMLQWLALSIVGVTLYAFFLTHLSWLYQSSLGLGYLLFVLVATPLNDVLAFMFGKAIHASCWVRLRRRCCRATSGSRVGRSELPVSMAASCRSPAG